VRFDISLAEFDRLVTTMVVYSEIAQIFISTERNLLTDELRG